MFLPLGFGTWPRVFPVAVIMLSLVSVIWSQIFFPSFKTHNEKLIQLRAQESNEYRQKKALVIRQACSLKFENNPVCDPANQTEEMKRNSNVFSPVLESVEILNYIQAFEKNPEDWPEEALKSPEYLEILSETQKLNEKQNSQAVVDGFTTKENISPFSLLKATFTHTGYVHLMGNLLFLIVFGVWVEQCIGAMLTLMIFIAGSFCGIGLQLFLSPQVAVLGSSGGVSAIMGAFFALFLRSEFQFLFTFVAFYFKRVSLPLISVFPFFYILSDIAGVMTSASDTGIAHWAHVVGLSIGFGFGVIYKQMVSFKDHQFFVQEAPFLRTLRKSQDPSELWQAFKSVMYWNCQNWRAVETFLRKTLVFAISFDDDNDMKFFKKHLSNYLSYVFRRGSINDMIQAIQLFPPQIALAPYIPNIPVSQILYVADSAAKMKMYDVAMPLYLASLLRLKDEKQIATVKKAVGAIHLVQGNKKSAVGGS